jgi:Zn-dependent M28 family amino/carboxypeptidase
VQEANEVEPSALAENVDSHLYRSDQAPFARAGVPVAFFHSGEHDDYHHASDEANLIDHRKVAHVARLVFRTAWLIAGLEHRPSFVPLDRSDPAAFILDY